MPDDSNKALVTYLNLCDASAASAELSNKINKRVKACLEKLNVFLNLSDAKRPAIVENYKPENYKARPPKKEESK